MLKYAKYITGSKERKSGKHNIEERERERSVVGKGLITLTYL